MPIVRSCPRPDKLLESLGPLHQEQRVLFSVSLFLFLRGPPCLRSRGVSEPRPSKHGGTTINQNSAAVHKPLR